MMLKFLVGLSLITAICGNAINPQNKVDLQQPTDCKQSEVLLKVGTILSGLLGSDGETVKVPDAAEIKYALTLIKKSSEEHPAENLEARNELKLLVNELAEKKNVILDDKRPLRTLLDASPIKNDFASNVLFRYELPSSVKPRCKAAVLNLIQVAQAAYANIAKNPFCTDENPEPSVPNSDGLAYYVPNGHLHQNPYNSVLPNPREEALKKVAEYLKAPENYNLNNIIALLLSLQPKAPYVSSLNDGYNPYAQAQIKNDDFSSDQNHAPKKSSDFSKNYIDVTNNYSPLQGDLNVNLDHAKDIANKLNAQNWYKNENTNAIGSNLNKPNGQPNPAVFHWPMQNYPPNKQAELQKPHMPVEHGNSKNEQNFLNPLQYYHNLYQVAPFGLYLNPYQNQANTDINKKLQVLEHPNTVGYNLNNNEGGLNNPSTNHKLYQNELPNKNIPFGFPWAFKPDNNLGFDKEVNDASGVTNAGKLDRNMTPKGQVELTYLLKRKRPLIYQPFYFVKYRLPYNYFIQNLREMLSLAPNLITPPTELYKGLIAPSNATEVSPDLASYPKEEIHNLVLKNGALVKAKYIEPNVTESTKGSKRDSSEVSFVDGDVGLNDENSNSGKRLNSNQNKYRLDLNDAGLNLMQPALDLEVGNQAALYHKRIPLSLENESLAKILAALDVEKFHVKPNTAVPSQANHLSAEENKASYIENQQPLLSQLYKYSPHNEMHQVVPSQLNPYLIDTQAGQVNPYAVGSQAALNEKQPRYLPLQTYHFYQENPLSKLGYQFVRPPYGSQSSSQIGPIPIQSPYVIGTQAALGLDNKFLGNNLISNNLHTYKQPRRLLGGFLNPNQYGINRPDLYQNGLGNRYPGVLGNQGMLGQPGYNYLQNGLGSLNPGVFGNQGILGRPGYNNFGNPQYG